ncbi:hypothetical protein AX15_007734 [Amanita polypyramis BW_CC]|nr:hypothetical protein AX15_007734 [Amanita polypyramis BW_CC]
MDNVPFAQQILPRRQAAKQASASIAQQLDDSDSDAAHAQRLGPQGRVTIKYGRKAKAMRKRLEREPGTKKGLFPNHPGALNQIRATSSNTSGAVSGGRRTQAMNGPSQDFVSRNASDSELTSIVDTDPCSSSLSPPPTSPFPPLTLRPFPLVPYIESGTNPNATGNKSKRKRREASSYRRRWKKKELGDFVWVLIDEHSRVYEHEDKAAREREHVWWPGRVLPGGGKDISIYLYGETAFKMKNVEISYPTEQNILPFGNSAGEALFHEPTYVTPSSLFLDVSTSPRKKAKRDRYDLGEHWDSAFHELTTERDGHETVPRSAGLRRQPDVRSSLSRASDGESLPEVGEDNWKASLVSIPVDVQKNGTSAKLDRKGRRKGKWKATPVSEGESDFGIRRLGEDVSGEDGWFPPPADDALQIPGETVLAKGTGGDKNYWPARVLDYIPPKSKKEKEGRYKIEYLDGAITLVKRDVFLISEEDEFATCKLGQFESSYDDAANDSETEDPLDSLSQSRYPSPTPAHPPPSQEVFCELDVRSQFAYTKPILVAILNEQYPPAKERHDMFLKGGQARKSAVDRAVLRGEMDPRTVGELQKWLCEWCLRDERLAKKQDNARQGVGKGPGLQNGGTGEAELVHDQSTLTPADSFSQSTTGSGAAIQPLPSKITVGVFVVAEESPDSSPVSVTMENVKPADQESSLSPMSELTHESTPVPNENRDLEVPGLADESTLSDLTELDDSAMLLALQPDARRSKMLQSPPRQHGCPAFEGLTNMEKLDPSFRFFSGAMASASRRIFCHKKRNSVCMIKERSFVMPPIGFTMS